MAGVALSWVAGLLGLRFPLVTPLSPGESSLQHTCIVNQSTPPVKCPRVLTGTAIRYLYSLGHSRLLVYR